MLVDQDTLEVVATCLADALRPRGLVSMGSTCWDVRHLLAHTLAEQRGNRDALTAQPAAQPAANHQPAARAAANQAAQPVAEEGMDV